MADITQGLPSSIIAWGVSSYTSPFGHPDGRHDDAVMSFISEQPPDLGCGQPASSQVAFQVIKPQYTAAFLRGPVDRHRDSIAAQRPDQHMTSQRVPNCLKRGPALACG